MNEVLRLSIVLFVMLLVGGVATAYFRLYLLRRDETRAGILALSATSWRDFIHLVLEALARRGYNRLFDRSAPSGDNDYTLEREHKRYLLTCKHGGAYVLGIGVVNELANEIRLAGAAGGLLVTPGNVADDARKPAALLKIELLDGAALWPELRDLLPEDQLTRIRTGAALSARRRVLMSWLLALLVGVVTYPLLPASSGGSADPSPGSSDATAMNSPAKPASARGAAKAPPIASATIAAPAENDTVGMEVQRKQLAATVTTLPGVERAIWLTTSTLQVFMKDENAATIDQVCQQVERYDALASSRLQLTLLSNTQAPTRFKQCRTY